MANYYNPETHEYFVDGELKPTVTEICNPISHDKLNAVPRHILDRKRDIGSLVHDTIETYLLCGEVDEDTLPTEVLNYFYSFVEWHKTYRPKIIYTEYKMFSNEFCGTTDLICKIDGKTILVDYKTSSQVDKKSLSVQLYGYYVLATKYGINIDECWYLQLKKDGYVFKPVKINKEWFELLLKHNNFMRSKYDGK